MAAYKIKCPDCNTVLLRLRIEEYYCGNCKKRFEMELKEIN